MPTTPAQTWKPSPFTIERTPGHSSTTIIFRLSGPFTARDMYGSLSPDALNAMFELQPTPQGAMPELNILDLSAVPYLDSAGLGVVVRHYVRCKSKGVRLVIAGADPRVIDLFKLCNLDGLISTAATVEEAETR